MLVLQLHFLSRHTTPSSLAASTIKKRGRLSLDIERMHSFIKSSCIVVLALIGLTTVLYSQAAKHDSFTVPVSYYKLPNGLRVVLSQDSAAPTVVVAVYY